MESSSSGSAEYAGFWQRALASLIDWLVVAVIATPVVVVALRAEYLVAPALAVAIVAFWRYCGATPGKLAVGVKIVDAHTGAQPSTARLALRLAGYLVSALPLWLGFVWIAIDRRKQGWHDKIARTVVIQEPD